MTESHQFSDTPPSHTPVRIVIAGGGAAGLELATGLAHAQRRRGESARPFSVTLVDKTPMHVWKPLLHEVASGTFTDQGIDYFSHAYQHGYEFQLGALLGIDCARRVLSLSAAHGLDGSEIVPARELPYDVLVIAIGSRSADFGIPGVREHCHLLDDVASARRLSLDLFSCAARAQIGSAESVRVGIVGGGATGVELATEIHHVIGQLRTYGANSPRDKLHITVVDGAKRLLSSGAEAVSQRALSALNERNVEVLLGERVQAVTADSLILQSGTQLKAHVKAWVSGITGHTFLSNVEGLSVDARSRVMIDASLHSVSAPGIFALGDCAIGLDAAGQSVPPTAQAASQQAKMLAASLPDWLDGKPLRLFQYRDRGTLVSLGESQAVGSVNRRGGRAPAIFAGASAKLLYTWLYRNHQATLLGWPRTVAIVIADALTRSGSPPIKIW